MVWYIVFLGYMHAMCSYIYKIIAIPYIFLLINNYVYFVAILLCFIYLLNYPFYLYPFYLISSFPSSPLTKLPRLYILTRLTCLLSLSLSLSASSSSSVYFLLTLRACVCVCVDKILCYKQFIFYVEWHIRENSRAKKRETTQHNTAKLTQPRPNTAAPMLPDTLVVNMFDESLSSVLIFKVYRQRIQSLLQLTGIQNG